MDREGIKPLLGAWKKTINSINENIGGIDLTKNRLKDRKMKELEFSSVSL